MQHPSPVLAGQKILIVEDEYFIAQDMADAIRGAGATVIGPVATREQALALLASDAPLDAAVLDINLQGDAVYPVADALRARGVPFVFATGYDRPSIAAAYRDVPCWEKVFDYAALVAALPGVAARGGG
jgi:CheY-like chemotaxis protein